jgi:hypothetical protein
VCISQFILFFSEQIVSMMNLQSAAKSKVRKYLDDIEERLISEVESVQEKNEEKINKEKHEICQLISVDILNFFKLHVNFINSRRHVMNLLVCFLDVCYLFS